MRESGVELEAASGESVEGGAGAPVERQKAPCLAGSCGGDFRTFHHGHLGAALAQKVGYASADHTSAANDDPHGPLRRSCCKAAFERLPSPIRPPRVPFHRRRLLFARRRQCRAHGRTEVTAARAESLVHLVYMNGTP